MERKLCGHIQELPHLLCKFPTFITMSMLTLNPITLYYWNIVMHSSPKLPSNVIVNWVSEVCPGAPPSHSDTTTQKTAMTHPHLSSCTGTTPPPSTAPSSLVSSVLTKSLAVSEPSLVKGLYRKPHKTVKKRVPTVSERISDEDSDIEIIEGGSDENQGPIESEDGNQSTNIEFWHAQDMPVKAKQLKKKAKVILILYYILKLTIICPTSILSKKSQ